MDMDFLLVQKMRMGDEKAVEAFVTKYYSQILRYCRYHVSDYGYAEDITQEAFERFFRSLSQYRHYGRAANYLYVIAGNLCRDFYRKSMEIAVEELPEDMIPNRRRTFMLLRTGMRYSEVVYQTPEEEEFL